MRKIIRLTVMHGDGSVIYSVGLPASQCSKIENVTQGEYMLFNLAGQRFIDVINCPVVVQYETLKP